MGSKGECDCESCPCPALSCGSEAAPDFGGYGPNWQPGGVGLIDGEPIGRQVSREHREEAELVGRQSYVFPPDQERITQYGHRDCPFARRAARRHYGKLREWDEHQGEARDIG